MQPLIFEPIKQYYFCSYFIRFDNDEELTVVNCLLEASSIFECHAQINWYIHKQGRGADSDFEIKSIIDITLIGHKSSKSRTPTI